MQVGEHPPDAHRGFDIPAAVLSWRAPCVGAGPGGRTLRMLKAGGEGDGMCLHEVRVPGGMGAWGTQF